MTSLFLLRSKRWPWKTPPIPSTSGVKLPAHIPLFSTFSVVTSEEMPCLIEGHFFHLRSEKHHLLLSLKLYFFIYPFCASYVIGWAVTIGYKHSLISLTKKAKPKNPQPSHFPPVAALLLWSLHSKMEQLFLHFILTSGVQSLYISKRKGKFSVLILLFSLTVYNPVFYACFLNPSSVFCFLSGCLLNFFH